MCEAGFHDEVDVTVGVKPIEECVHVRVDAWSGRRLKVDALLANRTGNDLHWPVAIVAPRSYPDFAHAATTSWEKRCMPVFFLMIRKTPRSTPFPYTTHFQI